MWEYREAVIKDYRLYYMIGWGKGVPTCELQADSFFCLGAMASIIVLVRNDDPGGRHESCDRGDPVI